MFACIVRFSRSENSNMLIKVLRGAKGVAIATKFTQKGQKCTDFSSVRNIVPISTYMLWFRGCRIQTCCLNFSGNKGNCYGNQIGKNKPKLHKFHFCIKYWEFFAWTVGTCWRKRIHIYYRKFSRDRKELPWQPNLSKRQPKLHSFHFCARNREILTVNSRVFGVRE